MRSSLTKHLSAAAASGLIFAACQGLVETVAVVWVYYAQILPPYGFFTTQLYDCFAKTIFFLVSAADLQLPFLDHFLITSWLTGLELLPQLLVLNLLGALLLTPLLVVAGLLLLGSRKAVSLRRYLKLWFLSALVINACFWVASLHFAARSTWGQVFYKHLLRPFVVDGALVALLVSIGALALGTTLVTFLGTSVVVARRAILVAAVLCVLGAVGWGRVTGVVGPGPQGIGYAGQELGRTGRPWNLLLISIDSLRADHVGCYGYRRNTSPAIDKLAAEGTRFANAISPTSWTLPAHLSLLTSHYALSHGVVDDSHALRGGIPTLAEVLRRTGYVTAGFVSAPYVAARYGFARGMDLYEDISTKYAHRDEARRAIVAPAVNQLALPWLEEHRTDRFFLFLHYFDVHYDYIPPPPFDTMFDPNYAGAINGRDFIENARVNARMSKQDLGHIIALYDGEIRFTDKHVGQLLDAVDRLGLRDRTLVVLVADHGDEFFEHGNKGHHRTLYDEVLRVPLIFRLPGGAGGGKVVAEQVSLVDVMPTILELLKVSPPTGMEGRSLASVFSGGELPPAYVYGAFYDKRGFNVQVMERGDGHKFIEHFNRITHPTQRPTEWYRLDQDAQERQDQSEVEALEMLSAQQRTAHWLERGWRTHRSGVVGKRRRVEIDDQTRQQLKSLGYIGD